MKDKKEYIADDECDTLHEAFINAIKDMKEEEDFIPMEEDPDMLIILDDEGI